MRFFTTPLPWQEWLRGGALTLCLAPLAPVGNLSAEEPRSSQLKDQTSRDWLLTNAARRALQSDEQLKLLNLGVSVKNRVATVWGAIPTTATTKRIEELLKKINGMAAVINECRIAPVDTLPQAVAEAVKNGRFGAAEPQVASVQLTMWPPPPPPPSTASRFVAKPGPEESTPSPKTLEPTPKGDENEAAPGSPLLPPPPAVVLLSPQVEPGEGDQDGAEKVRLSEPRFKDVSLDIRSGVVKINGKVARMKDAWDLADKLNNLAAIKQVVMGDVLEK